MVTAKELVNLWLAERMQRNNLPQDVKIEDCGGELFHPKALVSLAAFSIKYFKANK